MTARTICTSFFFEGKFRDHDAEHSGKGVFSSALVPCGDEKEAYAILEAELDEQGVALVCIEESFLFDPADYDLESRDPENLKFYSIYEEVERFKCTIFTPFELFPAESTD